MNKEDREYYKLLNDSYITHYINDTDNHNLYITFGAKLKNANEILNNKKEK